MYRGMLLLTGHDSTSSTRPRWGTIRRLSIHSGLSLPVPGGDDQVIVGTSPPVPLAGPSISRLHASGGRNGARNASPFCMRNQRAKPMPRSSGPDEVASLSRLRHVRDDAEAIGIRNLLIVAFARNGTVIPYGEFLIEPDFHRLGVFIGVALLERIVTGENMDGCFQALFCARPCHGLAGHLS